MTPRTIRAAILGALFLLLGCSGTAASTQRDGALSDTSPDAPVVDAPPSDTATPPDLRRDANPLGGIFDDSLCGNAPAHLFSQKIATVFSSTVVYADPRPHGDLAIAGVFTGDIILGTTTYTSDEAGDAFVAVFDASGALSWSTHLSGAGRQSVAGLARDGAGRVLVAGDFDEVIEIGDDTYTAKGAGNDFASDIFIASFEANGTLAWSKSYGGNGSDTVAAITASAGGALFLAGSFEDSIDLGGGALESTAPGISSSKATYFVSYDASGAHRWSKGSPLYGSVAAMTVDGAGNLYTTGGYRGDRLNFGDGDQPIAKGEDAFVVSHDSDGAVRWTRTAAGEGYDTGKAIVANDGLVVVAGNFEADLDMGLVARGPGDLFVAAYDTSGALQWSKSVGGSAFTRASAVSLDASGNVIVALNFTEDLHLESGALAAEGGSDIVLLGLTASGQCRWMDHFASPIAESATVVATSPSDHVFLSGWSNGPTDFGGGALEAGSGIFVTGLK